MEIFAKLIFDKNDLFSWIFVKLEKSDITKTYRWRRAPFVTKGSPFLEIKISDERAHSRSEFIPFKESDLWNLE